MKPSIFIFLLFLAFSSSVDFKLTKKPGIYLWEISNNFNEISKYESFDFPKQASSSSNVDSSEESYLGIPDSGILELGIAPQRTNTPNTFEKRRMNTHNTYIILKIDKHFNYSIYYWVGAQSSQEKRRNVAYLVGHMYMKIYHEIAGRKLKHFYREAEGVESPSFLSTFNLTYDRPKNRMYRVAGTKGQFVMEVPLTPSQLNGSDSFVLYKNGPVFIWNSLLSNPFIRLKAHVLGNYIHKTKIQKKFWKIKPLMWITEGFTDRKSDFYNSFATKFFEDMNANAEEKRFPHTPYYYTDTELENKRRQDVKLYKFSNTPHDSSPYEVPHRDLKLRDLDEKAAHVLADSICGNIFVIFGPESGLESVQKSLSFTEILSRSMQEAENLQEVIIILLDRDLPQYFEMYFSDSFSRKQIETFE